MAPVVGKRRASCASRPATAGHGRAKRVAAWRRSSMLLAPGRPALPAPPAGSPSSGRVSRSRLEWEPEVDAATAAPPSRFFVFLRCRAALSAALPSDRPERREGFVVVVSAPPPPPRGRRKGLSPRRWACAARTRSMAAAHAPGDRSDARESRSPKRACRPRSRRSSATKQTVAAVSPDN